MKRIAIATVLLSIFAGSPRAEAQPIVPGSTCYSVCPALIMPDVPAVKLPLAGWLYSGSLAQEVLVIEQPQFGVWDKPAQTYTPSPLFWNLGIDRMRVLLNSDPNQERTIIFQTAYPLIEANPTVYHPAETFYGHSAVGGLTLSQPSLGGGNGQTNGVAIVGGYVNASVPPPTTPVGITDILRLDQFAHVRLVHSPPNVGFAAVADIECGSTCETSPLWVTPGQYYGITLTLGYDSAMVPSASTLSLRLKICPTSGGSCQETAIVGLAAVDLETTIGLQFGILAGPASPASITVAAAKLWRGTLVETPTSAFEGFNSGQQQSFWGLQGPIALTQNTRNLGWMAETNLQTMNSTSRAWLSDYRPGGQRRARILMDMDVSSLNLAEAEYLLPLHAQGTVLNGTGKTFDLFLRYVSGVYKLRGRLTDDSGTTIIFTPPIDLNAVGVNRLGLHYNASPEPGQSGGTFHLSVNGALYSLQNVDIDQRVFETFNFGTSGFSGTPNLDPEARPRLLRLDNLTLVY